MPSKTTTPPRKNLTPAQAELFAKIRDCWELRVRSGDTCLITKVRGSTMGVSAKVKMSMFLALEAGGYLTHMGQVNGAESYCAAPEADPLKT